MLSEQRQSLKSYILCDTPYRTPEVTILDGERTVSSCQCSGMVKNEDNCYKGVTQGSLEVIGQSYTLNVVVRTGSYPCDKISSSCMCVDAVYIW